MKIFARYFSVIFSMLLLFQSTGAAMENKIKFDDETYNLSVDTKNGYNYYLKGENSDTWHSKITIVNVPDKSNPTEAAAEFAHEIQSKNPGASVLVYPDAAMAGYLTFPQSKDYYEYNTVFFQKGKNSGLDKFCFAKRFFASEYNGSEGARKAAIEFAEKYNKKYMEMVNKIAPKYKID